MNNNIDARYIKAIVFAFALIVAVFIFNSKVLNNITLKTAQNDVQAEEVPAPAGIPTGDLSDNYFSNAVTASGNFSVWQKMPINVYIQNNPFASIVKSAFDVYNANFGGMISFNYVDNPNTAQITVTFPSRLERADEEQFVAGLTNNFSSGHDIQSSTIKLLTQKDGIKFSSAFVYNTALHEIGHALGINGHSDNRADVMYPETQASTMMTLSARDMATLKIMYSKNAELINQNSATASSDKLQEALRYTRQAPNKTNAWINLGNVYYDLKMLPEALEAYKEALKIDPSDSNIYASMAECYYSSKKYETSAQFYEYAKERTYDPVAIENYEAMIALSKLSGQKYQEAYNLYVALVDKYPNKKDYFINYLYLCTYLKKPEGKDKLILFLQTHPDANNDNTIMQYKSYYKIP